MNAKQLKAIDALIERGVDPTKAAELVMGGGGAAAASSLAGPTKGHGKPADYVLHEKADLPCLHPTNPCKAKLRSNGPKARRHGPRGHKAVR